MVKQVSKEKDTTLVATLLDQAGERMPKYKKHIDTVAPYIISASNAVDKAWPYAVKGYDTCLDLWEKAQPYHPQQYGPLIIGLIICFFGGSYMTIIATVEAVRLTVWGRIRASMKILWSNYLKANDASKKDDEIDADNNGIPDVKEITKQELLSRKMYVFATSVDPNQVSEALAALWAAWLSVVATLRVQFAQAITLGCALGELLEKHLAKNARPVIDNILPADLKKWGPVATNYAFRVVGITIAWFLKRVIMAFHCATRGANMFVTSAIFLGKEKGLLGEDFEENSPKASIMAGAVAFLGFYWQLSNGFGLPFPLNVLLLPVSIFEWMLEMCVGVSM